MSQGTVIYNFKDKIATILSEDLHRDWILCGSAGLEILNNTENPVHDLDFIISEKNFIDYLKCNKKDTLLNKNPCNRFEIEQAPYTHFKVSNSIDNYGVDICLFVAHFELNYVDTAGIKIQNKQHIEIFRKGMKGWTSGWRNGKKWQSLL